MKKNTRGFSLIELVIFITVMGFAIGGLFLAFDTALQKGVAVSPQTIANNLAQGRMEFILGQKRINGFNALPANSVCSGATPVCTLPAGIVGYTINSSVTTNVTINSDSNYDIIDVTVSGPLNAYADIKTLVGK